MHTGPILPAVPLIVAGPPIAQAARIGDGSRMSAIFAAPPFLPVLDASLWYGTTRLFNPRGLGGTGRLFFLLFLNPLRARNNRSNCERMG